MHIYVLFKYVCIYTYIHTYIYVYIYIHIHTYIHTCIHTYIHTCIHIHIYIGVGGGREATLEILYSFDAALDARYQGTQFTCFTSTKVQMLTLLSMRDTKAPSGMMR